MLISNVAKYLAAFVGGVFVTAFVGVKWCYISFGLICFAVVVMIVFRKFILVEKLWVMILVMAVGSACFCFHMFFVYRPAVDFAATTQRVVGIVTEISDCKSESMCYTVRVSQIGDRHFYFPFNLKLYANYEIYCACGDEILTDVLLYENPAQNEGIFDSNISKGNYLKGKVVSEDNIQVIEKRDFLYAFLGYRNMLIDSVCEAINEPQSQIISGLIFGVRRSIPYSIQRAVDRCGLSHIFTVSGLHITILTAFLMFFLRLIKISKLLSIFVLINCLFCFSSMVGMTPSVVRACVMVLFSNVFLLLRKRENRLDGLLVSAVLILVFSPNVILGLSFILSFASCAGILLFAKPIAVWLRDRLNLCRGWQFRVIELFAVSLAANLMVVPFLIMAFGKISIVAPFVNLIIVPFIPVLFFLGIGVAVSGLFFANVAGVLGYICEGFCGAVFCFIELISKLPFCYIPANYGFVVPTVIFLLLFLLFTLCIRRGFFKKSFILIGSMLIVLVPTANMVVVGSRVITLTAIGNGYGHSLVLSGAGKNVVINCGGGSCSGRRLCQFLDSKGIYGIDAFIFTSIKNKHMMDVSTVIENIPISNLILSDKFKNSLLFKMASDREIDIFPTDNLHISIDSLKVDVIDRYNYILLLISVDDICFAYFDNIEKIKTIENLHNINVAIIDEKLSNYSGEVNFDYGIVLNSGDYNFSNFYIAAPDVVTDFIVDGGKLRKGRL